MTGNRTYDINTVASVTSTNVTYYDIAFIIDEISTSPHPVVSLDGVRDEAWASGLIVTSYVTRSNDELEQATIEAIINDPHVIGIIYSTIFTREVVLPEFIDGLPLILLNYYVADKRHTSIVLGEFNATQYLINKGHRRIGFSMVKVGWTPQLNECAVSDRPLQPMTFLLTKI